jgi:lysophospholipase L1-like esterase
MTRPTTAPGGPTTAPVPTGANGLAVQNGDVVVFLGDELSETPDIRRSNRPTFPQIVETFLTVRYPALHARYVTAGWSGDTAERALLRLNRDVLAHQPKVVVICLGMNDAGYLGFAADRLERFKQALAQIVQKCRQAQTRVWLISPPCVEEDRGKKVRVIRDGLRAVADLEMIHYNETLGRYAAAMKELAAADPPTGFVDWFGESLAARAHPPTYGSDESLTMDGRTPTFRGTTVGAAALLTAWGAQPIRATIELDWNEGTAQVSSHLGRAAAVAVQITEDGRRIVDVGELPLPWPLPGDSGGTLQEGWKATEMCQFIFRMNNPPELGVVLVQETEEQGATGQWPILSAQLQAGFNLATAEPLRSLKGVRELYNLVGTKNRTRDTIWRRLELSPPQERELVDAHQQLINAWKAYVAGYERIIARYPKTFNARFVLTEAVESENLPTSQPTRTLRAASPMDILNPSTTPAPRSP